MTIEILEDNSTINKKIVAAIIELISAKFTKFQTLFLNEAQPQIENFIRESETYESLIDGQLKGDFGIVSEKEIESIIQEFVDIRIELVKGGLNIYYDSPAFFEIVSLSKQNGSAVPWFQWLMLEGDKIVVEGFSVTDDIPGQAESRSGEAIMITGGDFRVDPHFSGTESDNWITRMLQDYLPEIKNISGRALQVALGGI